jgi:hypothetical protein
MQVKIVSTILYGGKEVLWRAGGFSHRNAQFVKFDDEDRRGKTSYEVGRDDHGRASRKDKQEGGRDDHGRASRERTNMKVNTRICPLS